jgi:hypothetical protein
MYPGRFCPIAGADGTSSRSGLMERRRPAGTAIFDRTRPGRVRCDMAHPLPGPVLVHFPHPKDEHHPGRMCRQPCNTNPKHRRKFLRSPGRYVTPDGSLAEAPLAFWAEWEAPSYVIQPTWRKEGDLPQFLQEPVWEHPGITGFRQNTDPWVFGDCFQYSNCHQLNRNQKGLRTLPAGSMILFGSTLGLASETGPRFVLDTVFVGELSPLHKSLNMV